jgi:hypothetical protein
MLRTRRPSTISLSPPLQAHRGKVNELPVYSVYLERVRSDESETSSSSSTEDAGEPFITKIQETFPLCRKNPHKEIAERRKALLVRSLLILLAVGIVVAKWNLVFPPDHNNNNRAVPATIRRLTENTENTQSPDSPTNQSRIRNECETKILQKFGEGPFLVEFELRVWGDDNRPAKYFFTMELAPTVWYSIAPTHRLV